MSEHTHLGPSAQEQLSLPPAERASLMLIERFITHDRLTPILDHIEFLLNQPRQSRASGLVVSGRPGSGKTMIARAIQRRNQPVLSEGGRSPSLPVMGISMTGAREAKTLYNRMLGQLGIPDAGRYSGTDRERMVVKLCGAADLRLLIVDEIQDILTSTPRQQRMALDTIKFLMNQLALPILVLGTSQAPEAMQVDEHLNARFRYRELPVWKQDSHLVRFLDVLESVLPLRKPSHLSSPTLSSEILRLSEGVLDPMMKLVTYAAAHAVESGDEQITVSSLQRARVEPPVAAVRTVADFQSGTRKAA